MSALRRLTAFAMLLLMAAGCTGRTEPQPPSQSPSPPPTFAPLPDGKETGNTDYFDDIATDGDQAVLVGAMYNGATTPTFRVSNDGGGTWTEGRLDEASAAATQLGGGEDPEHIVRNQHRWYAMGEAQDGMLAWDSIDGRVWQRTELDRTVFNPDTDDIYKLISAGDTLVAVGARTPPGGKSHPMAWRSTDGVTWTAREFNGEGWLTSLAARGSALVAVGANDDTFVVQRSTDGGRSWHEVSGIPRPAGDAGYYRGFSDVTATPTGFTAVGTAWTKRYVPIVYSSSDGQRWEAQNSAALAASPSATAEGVGYAGGQLIVTSEGESMHRLGGWVRRGSRWQPLVTPLSGGAGLANADWQLSEIVPSGAGWLVVVRRQDNGAVSGEVWRSTTAVGKLSRVEVKPAGNGRPFVIANSIALSGGAMTAAGRSQGLPVVWPGSGARFGPPQALSRSTGDALSGVVASGKDRLAFGSQLAGVNNDVAVVWSASGSGKWQRTSKQTFQTGSSAWAYSRIDGAARIGKRWYVVGERSDNGSDNESALVFSSVDGRRWVSGKAARVITKANRKVHYDITDLSGSNEVTRRMTDIAGVPGAVVAVGATGKDERSSAAVWRSTDGNVWHLAALPHGEFERSQASSVVSRGEVVIAAGAGWRAGSAKATPVTWSSTDGGRSWRVLPLAADGPVDSGVEIAVTKGHFVVLASRDDAGSQPWAWISEKGTDWHRLDLAVPSAASGELVTLSGIVGDGPDLVGLLHRSNREGTVSTVLRQRVD